MRHELPAPKTRIEVDFSLRKDPLWKSGLKHYGRRPAFMKMSENDLDLIPNKLETLAEFLYWRNG